MDRPLLVSLLLGPAGLLLAGRRLAAIASGLALGSALLVYAWIPYLSIFLEVDGGGTAQDVTRSAVLAAELWLRAAPSWAPGAWWIVALANGLCAGWLAWQRRSAS